MSVDAQEVMVHQLVDKIQKNRKKIIRTERYRVDDADIVLVSYGISARTSYSVVDEAREMGLKVGMLRLITVWPFPEEEIRALAERVKGFITVELNLGQIHLEVQRCAAGKAPAFLAGHTGGTVISPDQVMAIIKEAF
jgi:2-oxoglutarate/2-oxoacid ferredoxin oxidoreductase subunit alpha